jgi:hypothetical protein
MSGILDSKSRVMDTVLTQEGKRQLASGKMRVEYVSFTDVGTFYSADLVSGSTDASARVYLEHCNLPQDQITFEADDSGRLQPFKNGDGIQLKDGQILEYSFNALTSSILTGSNQNVRILRGDEFASTSETLLASSIDNFKKLRVIGTRDRIFEDDGFAIGNKDVEFLIHDDRPISDATNQTAHINHLESLFNDVRLSNVTNFDYLPPINKVHDSVGSSIDKSDHRSTSAFHLGRYVPWGRSHISGLTGKQLEEELRHFELMGYSRVITFDPTSRDNKIVAQFFEVNFSVMKKLDVIDFGSYVHRGERKHAFFVGKVMTDENGCHTFIHLFTLVFG